MTSDDAAEPAAVRETHIGLVFLVGDRAYKLKKPVRTPVLDFSTRRRRLAVCRREVALNRRLAPDVYLGVADVVGADGKPCDHVVVMRRMPERRRLSRLLRDGAELTDTVRQLARLVASFHSGAQRGTQITEQGGRDALRDRWTANLAEVRPFAGTVVDADTIDEIEHRMLRFLRGREPLLAARQRAGRVVDGHGDLLTDDIFCLPDGPRVLDCLEFDDRLRYVDGLDDAAFLAMDLEYRQAQGLATRFLDWYADFAGDPAPPSLRHHYIAYRAFVRTKVACLRSDQADPAAGGEARRYAEIALRHLRAGEVRLVLVGGTPGTGKSTVGDALAGRLGAAVLSSDRIRKELHGLAPVRSAAAGYRQGIYDEASTERTYREMFTRAGRLLGHGESVIMDASWSVGVHRAAATELADQTDAALIALRCTAADPIVQRRLRVRRGGISDADVVIGAAVAEHFDPWPEAVRVPTDGGVRDAVDRAFAALPDYAAGVREGVVRVHQLVSSE